MFQILVPILVITSLAHAQGLVLKFSASAEGSANRYALQERPFESELFDLDGDGFPESIMLRTVGVNAYYDARGTNFDLLWTSYPEYPASHPFNWPMFVDLTGDGVKEIVLSAGNSDEVTVVSWSSGECILCEDSADSPPWFMDFDDDSVADIVVFFSGGSNPGHIEIWGAGSVQSSPPSNLVIAPEGDNLILNWQPVDSCSMYRVYWSFQLNGEYASVGTSCIPSFTHPGAAIAPLAFYRVVAITSTNDEQIVAQSKYVKHDILSGR